MKEALAWGEIDLHLNPIFHIKISNFGGFPGVAVVKNLPASARDMGSSPPWVRALVREDPTCHGVTKPVRHNY